MRFHLGFHESPVGSLPLVWDDEEWLRLLYFDGDEGRIALEMQRRYGPCTLVRRDLPDALARPLDLYFAGDLHAVDAIAVAPSGTPFQLEVWAALRAIPPGTTMSYGGLAMKLGRPGASRAVGLANGSNPIALVVPCHRVIGANGSLTGFGGGLARKQWLLDHERRHSGGEPQLSLFAEAGRPLPIAAG